MKQCVLLENKPCNACGECNKCDLDPKKICDNCCACIEKAKEESDSPAYAHIPVADVVAEEADSYLDTFFQEEGEEVASDPSDLPFYEEPDPALLAYWEEKLREADAASPPQNAIRGVRKRRDRDN